MSRVDGNANPKLLEADRDRLAAVSELLHRASDVGYPIEVVAEEKCFGSGVSGAPVCLVAEQKGQLLGIAVVSGPYLRLLAVDPRARKRGIGSSLLARSEATALEKRQRRLVIAAEPGNYFVPGVPENQPSVKKWLEHRGYRAHGRAINLAADLEGKEFTATSPDPKTTIVRVTREERSEVLHFVRQEFSPTWAFEISPAFDDPVPPLFIARESGKIIGFSAHDVNNRGLGFFGPAGVKATHRGGGLGRVLLHASLTDLQRRGYERIIIPWVSTIEFYRRNAGAEPEQSFVRYQKSLS
jgi:GNAT superfamily N-acetyltransferase